MENRINQVMTLGNGEKYLILRQAIYEDENYYVCVKTTDDAKEVTDSYELLHEFLNDGVKVAQIAKVRDRLDGEQTESDEVEEIEEIIEDDEDM